MGKKSKSAAKAAAKTAAAAGTLSRQNIQSLKSAGVKQSVIQGFRATNKAAGGSIARSTDPGKSVRGNILKYGSKNANISGKELMKISEATGKSQAQVIKQLDKLNAKKDLQIGLGQGALSKLIKGVPSLSDGGWGAYGTGAIGSAVGDYGRATNAPTQSSSPSSGSTNLYGSLDVTPGLKQSFAGLIPLQPAGGMQINAKGGLSPKTANDLYLANKMDRINGTGPYAEPVPAPPPPPPPSPQEPQEPQEPVVPPEPEDPTLTGSGLTGGGEGAGGASYLKAARSRWRRLGISTQGTSALSRGLNYTNMFGR